MVRGEFMKNTKNLLIFPAGIDGTEKFAKTATQLGFDVVGGSSVPVHEVSDYFKKIVPLPFITDKCFDKEFLQTIEKNHISHVYAPHHGVWWHVKKMLANSAFFSELSQPLSLCGEHPFQSYWNEFEPHLTWADKALQDQLAQSIGGVHTAPAMSRLQYAALHRGFLRVPGESDSEKLTAMSAIARLVPAGDVVEIGSLFGRSAYALARLAQHYRIGSTICVDPWRMEQIVDQGAAAKELFDSRSLINLDHVFAEFCATASEVGSMGYIRAPSVEAIDTYREAIPAQSLHSPDLGDIPVCGKIALLHIDGNHRYDHVVQDIATWTPHLMHGGWLLLDDYVWSFGDGPQRAGDELLRSGDYDLAFVASDTLFLRRRPA